MIIKKKEAIEFSMEEQRCIDMTYMLMEAIAANATDPDLVKTAEKVAENLGDIYQWIEGAD